MSVIGNINVKVGANIADLSKGLDSASKEVGGFGSGLASLAMKGGGLAAGFFGVSSAIEAFSNGIKGAADMEQAEIGFGVLFKSADTAKAVLGDLSKFAAETPFELPELTSAARSLAAFGVDASAITPTLRMLGDVASGINQPLGEIAEIFGKARVQGRLFGEDINQLTGRGIPVIGELAKQFGVGESEVKKLVESGKIGFPQLQKAFESMTGSGGQFNGMMAAQSQSLSGLWSTMNDGIGGALRDFSGYMLEAFNVKEGIAGLTSGIDIARGAFEGLKPYFEQLINFGSAIGSGFMQAFGMISEGVSTTFSFMNDFTGGVLSQIDDAIFAFWATAEWAVTNLGNLWNFEWETVKLGAVALYGTLEHMFTTQLPAIWNWASESWGDTWSTMLDYTLTILTNLGTNIRGAMQEIWDWISSGGTDAMEFAWTPLTEGAVSAMKELPDIPERAISEMEMNLRDSVASLSSELSGSLIDHVMKRQNELLPEFAAMKSGGAAAGIASLPTPPAAKISTAAAEAPKLAGAFVKGSLDEQSLRNKIESGPDFSTMIGQNKQMIDIAKRQLTKLDDIGRNKPKEYRTGQS